MVWVGAEGRRKETREQWVVLTAADSLSACPGWEGAVPQQRLPDPEGPLGDLLVWAWEECDKVQAGRHPSHGWCGETVVTGKLGTSLQGPEYREASSPYFPWFTDTLTQLPPDPRCPGHLGPVGPINPAAGVRPGLGQVEQGPSQHSALESSAKRPLEWGMRGGHSRPHSTVLDVAAA